MALRPGKTLEYRQENEADHIIEYATEGQPDYGSLGATCNVEFEADAGLLQQDLDAFHRRVRDAYAAAAQAVNDELARHQGHASGNGAASTHAQPATQASSPKPIPTSGNGNGHTSSNGHTAGSRGPSEKQMTYLRQLAGQIRGLGVRQLDALAQRMFGKPVAGLSSHDASGLIDALKAAKAGELDLNVVLEEVSS